MWYEGISHQYASAGTKVKVRYKNGRFGGIRVSQTHLIILQPSMKDV